MITIADVMTVHPNESKAKGIIFRPTAADVWVYSLTFGPGILLLAAVWFQTRVPVPVLMKDPLAVVQLTKICCHFYYGLVSNLGIMIWTAGAAVCVFASLVLFSKVRPQAEVIFFVAAAAFTGWLALDDLFMIHEDVLPQIGVPENITYAFYAGTAAAYFYFSWRSILASRPMLMASALALLGTSVAIDVLVHSESAVRVFAEDGAKLLGILAWTSFHVTAAFEIIGARMKEAGSLLDPCTSSD